MKDGVIFHKGQGAKLYNFRGYHLAVKDNKLELLLAHLHPDNAIVEQTLVEVPKNRWIQLTLTYDGSSRASGLKVFLDGAELETKTVVDNLFKDIVFNPKANALKGVPKDPGLQIGARWRGKGIGGSVVDDILVFKKELSSLEVAQIANPALLEKIIAKKEQELSTAEKKGLDDLLPVGQIQKTRTVLKSLGKSTKDNGR